jgi:hypothetical protein
MSRRTALCGAMAVSVVLAFPIAGSHVPAALAAAKHAKPPTQLWNRYPLGKRLHSGDRPVARHVTPPGKPGVRAPSSRTPSAGGGFAALAVAGWALVPLVLLIVAAAFLCRYRLAGWIGSRRNDSEVGYLTGLMERSVSTSSESTVAVPHSSSSDSVGDLAAQSLLPRASAESIEGLLDALKQELRTSSAVDVGRVRGIILSTVERRTLFLMAERRGVPYSRLFMASEDELLDAILEADGVAEYDGSLAAARKVQSITEEALSQHLEREQC